MEDPPRYLFDIRDIRHIGKHYRELIATQPSDLGYTLRAGGLLSIGIRKIVDRIFLAQLHGQAFGNLDQQAVAPGMADGIIDALEVIEIDKQQCRGRAMAAAALEQTT